MQLQPGERSILASFPSSERAAKAARALEEAGFDTVQVDRVGKYGGMIDNRDLNNPVASQAVTVSGLTQLAGDEFGSRNAGPLVAADPAASGISGPPVDDAGVLLTAVVSEDEVAQAAELIKRHGGRV